MVPAFVRRRAGAAQGIGITEPLRQFEPIMDMLGSAGIWARHSDVSPEVAGELERLGYSTLWLGASPPAELDVVDSLLGATETLVVGTSIVNIWTAPATSVAVSFHRLEAKYPGRFVLGIGAGHRENQADYRKPYEALVDYLDELDRAGVPVQHRALAALGPRVLDLARTRSAGALPYLVTPEHTRSARARLGPDALLVFEVSMRQLCRLAPLEPAQHLFEASPRLGESVLVGHGSPSSSVSAPLGPCPTALTL